MFVNPVRLGTLPRNVEHGPIFNSQPRNRGSERILQQALIRHMRSDKLTGPVWNMFLL